MTCASSHLYRLANVLQIFRLFWCVFGNQGSKLNCVSTDVMGSIVENMGVGENYSRRVWGGCRNLLRNTKIVGNSMFRFLFFVLSEFLSLGNNMARHRIPNVHSKYVPDFSFFCRVSYLSAKSVLSRSFVIEAIPDTLLLHTWHPPFSVIVEES